MSTYQDFGLAKQKLYKILLGILDYRTSAYEHINDLSEICPDVIDGNELNLLSNYGFKVDEIYKVLTHAHMKVAVFGRTSSGKSTVVNAMLGKNVLPSGIGHTTNSFLQVEGSPTGNAYLSTEGILSMQHNVESATYLAYILKNVIKPKKTRLIHVCWPKEKYGLLKDNVVLVDSPGIDTTLCLDEWIDGYCINADALVLVVNAESTLMDTEMNFLHKVSKKLPNANIFILINCSDESELLDQDRKQKMKKNIDLLEKKLKECIPHEPYSRRFLISAKEVLEFRVKVRSGLKPNIKSISKRYLEFLDFEKQLEDCISRSALLKFFNYSIHGKYLLSKMNTIMDIINIRSQEQTHLIMSQINEIQDKLNFTEEQFEFITNQNLPTTAADYSFSSFNDSLAVEPNFTSIPHVSSRNEESQGSDLEGYMFKTIEWNSMIPVDSIYAGVSLYEYLSWTTKTKEQSLKNQYIDHATSKLSVGLTSANYSQQVQQEPFTAFPQTDQLFDEFAINLNEEIKNLNSELNIITKSFETPMIFINDDVYWLNEDFNQLHSFLMDKIHFFFD